MEEKPNYYAVIPANVRYDNTLKDKAKLLYGEIVALSDKNGYCFASNRYFAELYSISTTTVSLLIKELIEKNYIESEIIYKEGTKEILNRYLRIVKDPYLRNLKDPIKENLKDNNTSINNTSINKKNNIKKDEQFEQFYKEYPKKVGKAYAKKCFDKLKLTDELFELIIINLKKQKEAWKHNKTNKQYIPNPSTWLNQERWNDDILIQETLEERIRRISEQLEKEGKI